MGVVRALLGVLLLAPLAACVSGAGAASTSPGPDGTVVLDIHYSAFSVPVITVERGQTVRFVLVNQDPIPHELIIGDQGVQDRHERGTEAAHGDRPGEVSVAPGATAETTVTFLRRGRLLFGCHLPGHWAYGMRGTITVR